MLVPKKGVANVVGEAVLASLRCESKKPKTAYDAESGCPSHDVEGIERMIAPPGFPLPHFSRQDLLL
jgi:hypothetical protein